MVFRLVVDITRKGGQFDREKNGVVSKKLIKQVVNFCRKVARGYYFFYEKLFFELNLIIPYYCGIVVNRVLICYRTNFWNIDEKITLWLVKCFGSVSPC